MNTNEIVLHIHESLDEDTLHSLGLNPVGSPGEVVDFDGRAATSTKHFQVDPEFLVGVSHHPDKMQMGDIQDLKLVVVDREGKKLEDGALKAVNLGDDADTTGAIYAQLAGAHYGEEAIPERWRMMLHRGGEIREMAVRLLRASMERRTGV